jgi:hypothetical protein
MVDGSLILQPRVLVKFTNPEDGKSITVNALVESGASISFLNIGLAEELGVDLAASSQGGVSSANKDDMAYYHDLKIHARQDTHEFVSPCGFMDFRTDAVVGQTGFFEHYRVVFGRIMHDTTLPERWWSLSICEEFAKFFGAVLA